MKLIDLHCDTLYESVTKNIPLDDLSMEVQPLKNDDSRLQCYAIWLPDDLGGDNAEKLFFKAAKRIDSECKRLNINLITSDKSVSHEFNSHKTNAMFTVENGLALNGKIENVKKFAELGVRMMTLTWNDSNQIGDGAKVNNPKGITEFGKSVIREMEKHNIVVDISHASDKLFYDVAELANRPFVASHSNSRSVTNNKRNLTDEQFNVIRLFGGIVGLNFHNEFLNSNSDKASMYDIIRHADYFLSLGGENNLSIGSDFDGCTLPEDITGSESMYEIYDLFLRHNYKESLVDKIFFKNALNFFENFDNRQKI